MRSFYHIGYMGHAALSSVSWSPPESASRELQVLSHMKKPELGAKHDEDGKVVFVPNLQSMFSSLQFQAS